MGVMAFAFCRYVGGIIAPLGWVLLAACWLAALVSFARAKERRELLDAQTGLDSLKCMHWREFEMLVGEAFRRRGWEVEETGMGRIGGKDGGIDLILRKHGRTELVQCKHLRERLVRASVVREMWGLVDHHRADAVNIVCSGDFTADAAAFTEGKAIRLINGKQLMELVGEVQRDGSAPRESALGTPRNLPIVASSVESNADTPQCPACGKGMLRRSNKRSGQSFWGCSRFPACRGTRPFTTGASAQ